MGNNAKSMVAYGGIVPLFYPCFLNVKRPWYVGMVLSGHMFRFLLGSPGERVVMSKATVNEKKDYEGLPKTQLYDVV